MRALVLNGARRDGETVDRATGLLADLLAERGWDTDVLTLREMEIRGCLGCFSCWVKSPGECIIDDGGRDVARMSVQSDLVVWLSPVTFGGYSSELKKALDRMIPVVSPFFEIVDGEVHHRKRYETIPPVIALGSSADPDGGEAATFRRLHERNARNLRPQSHAAAIVPDDADDATIRDALAGLLEEVL